ncbi:MAG TPA: hydroxysqualene dehydroxylase HpnE [Ignavibacteria bacterium]
MIKKVTVIGGGVAGLSSAVFLKNKGFDVQLYESSPKLGGRASSYFDKDENMYFDNGQHIFAGWYEATFEYLKLIGTFDNLDFQKSLNIKFIDNNKNIFEFSAFDLPVPFNLLFGFLKFKVLHFRDVLKIIRLLLFIRKNNFNPVFDGLNLDEIFKIIPQSINSMKYFWEPLIISIFNSFPEKVSFKIFKKVIAVAYQKKSFSALVLPKVDLYSIITKGAENYFRENQVEVHLSEMCQSLKITNNKIDYALLLNGSKIYSDDFVLAVPYYNFFKIFSEEDVRKYFPYSKELTPSSVISIHIIFEDVLSPDIIPFNEYGMLGITGKTIQWIFRKSNCIISLTLSAVDFDKSLNAKTNSEIFDICLKELFELFVQLKPNRIIKFKVIREKRATFISDAESLMARLNSKAEIKNLYLAGDWVNTGLPSTIESAVKSSKIISELMVK